MIDKGFVIKRDTGKDEHRDKHESIEPFEDLVPLVHLWAEGFDFLFGEARESIKAFMRPWEGLEFLLEGLEYGHGEFLCGYDD